MAGYKENVINKIKVGSTDYPISYTETEFKDTTNNVSRYQGDSAIRKVYTDVLGVSNGSSPNNNTYANESFYFLTVKPTTWDAVWTVKYHLNIHLTDETKKYKSSSSASTINIGLLERGTYNCELSGSAGAYTVFKFFQSQKNTSYRPIYYHMLHNVTSAGFTAGYGHKIGVSLVSSYLPVPTTDYSGGSAATVKYGRTIEVIIDEAINCEVSLVDTLEVEGDAYNTGDMQNYTKLNTTYYTTSTGSSNSAGRWINLAATTQGLYESGDDNTVTYTQQSSNYLKNGTAYTDSSAGYFLGYNLGGFDKDGKALAISKTTPTTTAYTTSISTTRVYCNVGFDYTKGIRYFSTSANFAAGADMNISTQINYSGLDFRYTDNCIASGSANTLGLVNREPVYLRGTIGTDGLFYLDPITVTYNNNSYKRAWVQPGDATRLGTNPFDTTHVYWFIGHPYYNSSYPNSLYQFNLITQGELSMWDGTQLVPYSKAAPVTSVNNKTGAVTLSAADVGALSTHQNEYGKIKVGTSTTTADAVQDTIEFAAGGNISVTISGDKITYSYTTPASLPANGGNAASLGGSAPAYYLSYGNFTGTPSTLPNAKKLNIYANSDTTALIGYSGGETADTTFRINASTTSGAFNITDGTTTKTIQLAGDFTNTHYTSTWSVYAGATLVSTFNQSANRSITFSAGNNITLNATANSGVITISGTGDTHYTSTWSVYAGTTCISTFNQSANRSITFSAGDNITLTGTANSGVITISGTGDTHYTSTWSVYAGANCVSTFNQSANRSVTFSGASGITVDGTAGSGIVNIGHTNTAITAQTTQAVYPIKIDAYGHITSYGTAVTIPTVYNSTFTIQGNGTAAATFTANQSTNSTLNIKGSGGTTVSKTADGEITVSTGTIPTVTDYYWANVKVAATSATNTAPTFATASLTSVIYMSGTTSKAYTTYNATDDCIEFIFN